MGVALRGGVQAGQRLMASIRVTPQAVDVRRHWHRTHRVGLTLPPRVDRHASDVRIAGERAHPCRREPSASGCTGLSISLCRMPFTRHPSLSPADALKERIRAPSTHEHRIPAWGPGAYRQSAILCAGSFGVHPGILAGKARSVDRGTRLGPRR
jgi:hypothetical protein